MHFNITSALQHNVSAHTGMYCIQGGNTLQQKVFAIYLFFSVCLSNINASDNQSKYDIGQREPKNKMKISNDFNY